MKALIYFLKNLIYIKYGYCITHARKWVKLDWVMISDNVKICSAEHIQTRFMLVNAQFDINTASCLAAWQPRAAYKLIQSSTNHLAE